jgi:hypothetical protein
MSGVKQSRRSKKFMYSPENIATKGKKKSKNAKSKVQKNGTKPRKRKRIILTAQEEDAIYTLNRAWYYVRDTNENGSPEQYSALHIIRACSDAVKHRVKEPRITVKFDLCKGGRYTNPNNTNVQNNRN